MAIVVVERFKQQSLYGLSLGQPKVAIGGLTVPTCTAFLCTVVSSLNSPQNRILQLISKINYQWLSAFFAHTGRGCDFHEPI